MKEKEIQIQKKAYTDGLTGVFNRNMFDEIAKNEIDRYLRYNENLSVAIADIDHFKNFNDKYGHLMGDEILIMLAQNLNDGVRKTDTFARWGGEEFAILFSKTSKEEAKVICEKLRINIEKLSHPTAGNITVSFGITQYNKKDTFETFFQRCDETLYKAKKAGRNRICIK